MKNYREKLRYRIKKAYEDSIVLEEECIYRGHAPSLSCMVENTICYYVKDLLGDGYTYYIDPTISKENTKNGKCVRPDILVVKNNIIQYVIEVKANSGWARRINEEYLKKLISDFEMFKEKNKEIKVEYKTFKTNDDKKFELIKTNSKVKYLYVVLTSRNNSDKNHENNYKLLKANGIKYFTLFSGWYTNLKEINKGDMSIDCFEKVFK